MCILVACILVLNVKFRNINMRCSVNVVRRVFSTELKQRTNRTDKGWVTKQGGEGGGG